MKSHIRRELYSLHLQIRITRSVYILPRRCTLPRQSGCEPRTRDRLYEPEPESVPLLDEENHGVKFNMKIQTINSPSNTFRRTLLCPWLKIFKNMSASAERFQLKNGWRCQFGTTGNRLLEESRVQGPKGSESVRQIFCSRLLVRKSIKQPQGDPKQTHRGINDHRGGINCILE